MSHLATVEIELNDIDVLKETCKKLDIDYEIVNDYEFYDGSIRSGFAIHLDGWKYPAIVSNDGSEIYMDNYNGSWGDISELNRVKQYYGVEKAKKAARRQGYSYREVKNDVGEIELRIKV